MRTAFDHSHSRRMTVPLRTPFAEGCAGGAQGVSRGVRRGCAARDVRTPSQCLTLTQLISNGCGGGAQRAPETAQRVRRGCASPEGAQLLH